MGSFSPSKHNVRLHNESDVLIVGAGPTGLTLAAQLHTFGTRFRIIDRLDDLLPLIPVIPARSVLPRTCLANAFLIFGA